MFGLTVDWFVCAFLLGWFGRFVCGLTLVLFAWMGFVLLLMSLGLGL